MTPAAPDLVVVGGARLDAAAATLAEAGYPVRRGADGPALERLIDEAIPAAILLDASLPDLPALLAELSPGCGVIVLTAEPSVDEALEAIRAGAADYLPAGAPLPILARALDRICTVRRLQDDVEFWRSRAAPGQNAMLGQSPVMGALRRTIELVAHAAAPILITGEGGTGKSAIAQVIHATSGRASRQLVAVDCDSTLTPADLFGSEGQGHVGRGILAQAQGGTLLLNDIERLPETIYAPLLRLLEQGRVRRIGGTQFIGQDIRVIATTSADLKARVAEGTFRDELFYRLSTLEVHAPALRDRPEDIPAVAHHLLETRSFQRDVDKRFAPEAIDALVRHHWPGNLRELHNAVDRGVIMSADAPEITSADLGLRPAPGARPAPGGVVLSFDHLPTAEELRARYIDLLLDRYGGNRQKVAQVLGISERTTYRIIRKAAE
ncbi:sigma-54-dependent transcriptional regulator [Paracoccus sanguinis]|uniref:sigma-54-dependent transcriptional regulator n=1 Tax=Paracoccus sanguinis TaxID=1545044 RepID=UPI0006978D42|nr:sigma-54 dependent transcriptional regulator [Paracoccus sanguinis]